MKNFSYQDSDKYSSRSHRGLNQSLHVCMKLNSVEETRQQGH